MPCAVAMSAQRLDVVSQIGWIRGMEETHTSVKSRCGVEPRWVEPVSWMIPCHLVLVSMSQGMILPNEIFENHTITLYPDFFLHHDTDLCHYKNNISHFLPLFCCSIIGELRTESFPWGARSQASRSSNARWPSGAFPLGGTFQDWFFWIEKESRTNKTCGDSLFFLDECLESNYNFSLCNIFSGQT